MKDHVDINDARTPKLTVPLLTQISQFDGSVIIQNDAHGFFMNMLNRNYPHLDELFAFVKIHDVVCQDGRTHTISEPHGDHSVFPKIDANEIFHYTLESLCFENLEKPKPIDNDWKCEKCHGSNHVEVTQSVFILPSFRYLSIKFLARGNDINEYFLPKRANLQQLLHHTAPSLKMKLISIVHFNGHVDDFWQSVGHYTCRQKITNNDDWLVYNDDSVKRMPSEELINDYICTQKVKFVVYEV
jgi:hypothetical protein